jgi:hypothetical protein
MLVVETVADTAGASGQGQVDKSSVIPLFGQTTDHSSVPPKTCTAVARSGGPGRPSGRRASEPAEARVVGIACQSPGCLSQRRGGR